MAQQYEISRLVHEVSTFAASTQQATKNPISFGLDPQQRIDYLDIQVVGQLTSSGETTIAIDSKSERDDLLDALISQVRLYSSPLGDVIRTLSFSEIGQCVSYLNADFLQSNLPRPGQSKNCETTGEYDFKLNLSVPFRLDATSVQALYAPRVAQFPDGGISFKTGDGSASLGGKTWAVDSATTVQFRMRGPVTNASAKVSPLLYEKVTTSSTNPEFQSGVYMLLMNNTDSAATAYGTGGASAGLRIMIDGETAVEMNDYDPLVWLGSMIQNSPDPSAYDLDIAFYDESGKDGRYIWDRVGIPVFYTTARDKSFNFTLVRDRCVLELGSNWTTSCDWLNVRIRPLDEVGDVPGCSCRTNSGSIVGNPGEGAGSSAVAKIVNPRIEVAG